MTGRAIAGYDSVEGLDAGAASELRHVLVACVDTKLLLGYHYGEWTFGTPELEAAVASCSLSQGELGHVRLLCAVLHKHFGDDPDALVEQRPANAFANVRFLDRPVPDWEGFVAMNYVVDLAVTRLLHALHGSAFRPLRMSVDKMLDEERHHLHHGRGWVRTLAGRDDGTRERLAGRIGAALATTREWFGPARAADTALVEAGVKSADNPSLARAVGEDVTAFAAGVGLDVETPGEPAFDTWDPTTRRLHGGGPDGEILFHLRGSKNAIYRLR